MLAFCRLAVPVLAAGLFSAAADTGAVADAANRLEQQAGKAPPSLALEFRLQAAKSLEQRHADLARKFVDATLKEVREGGKNLTISSSLVFALTDAAPSEAAAIVPQVAPAANSRAPGAMTLAALSSRHAIPGSSASKGTTDSISWNSLAASAGFA